MEMNLMKYMLMILFVFVFLIVSLNHFEKEKEENEKMKNFVKNFFSLVLLGIFGFLIVTRLDSGIVDFFGYKIENGLIIYIVIILFVCLIM
tara:strand:+ start:293 stop:565 length:273 start_codon:yes stop_codon:yes gene_type:complete